MLGVLQHLWFSQIWYINAKISTHGKKNTYKKCTLAPLIWNSLLKPCSDLKSFLFIKCLQDVTRCFTIWFFKLWYHSYLPRLYFLNKHDTAGPQVTLVLDIQISMSLKLMLNSDCLYIVSSRLHMLFQPRYKMSCCIAV